MKRRKFIKGSAIIGMSLASPALISCNSGIITPKTYRKIFQIINADRTKVGTLPILRAFAGDHLDHVSPYVLFDEFGPVEMNPGIDPLRVDAHPHAGVIPTTYFLEGSGHHKDSLNYDFQIGKGEFMMFSSGKGAIHMEETGKKLFDMGGKYHGFQIWLNMPAAHKFIDPATDVHKEEELGKINHKDYTANIVLGELYGAKSKIELLSPAFYYHLKINPDGRLDIPTDPMHNAFVYVVHGQLEVENQKVLKTNQIALYQRGDSLINVYSEKGAEVLVLGGQPLNETVYSYGPFVMNTKEQINQCISAYKSGKMGNPDLVNR
ncbi:MAG: redox-sensitive bicupin YhaK (pirin superfamily) [Saprospiraceae bacterium]|jgi:redox-sensitive bicupin YhaK (pirin superfamily)